MPADLGRLIVSCDGAARGNPGPAGIGAVVSTPEGEVLAEIAEGIGETTNNVAEYRALIAGLERAGELGASEVAVFSDSDLLVNQMNGLYKIKHPNLKPLAEQAKALEAGFRRVEYSHVRRERNTHADRLANVGVDTWLASRR